MGYQITYEGNHKIVQPRQNRTSIIWLCFGAFLLFVCAFWPEGREVLKRMLWPGDGDAAVRAAGLFVDSVQCGLSFRDAAEIFCLEVLSGAQAAG